ncbi:hypothetical protein M405DRAFT_929110 [Rhizopogon salebrosus TDB-379]|nr:hypothetical protein M405DRAFT_929110 [Rhizopogon salebrosus TDB-379]
MISSPTKRLLTEDERTSRITPVIYGDDATPSDVIANIRNAAMRARKNVLEGYRTQPSAQSTPNSSPAKHTPTARLDERIYPSANDTLREVFAPATSGTYTPTSSPTKRRRSNADPEASSDVASDSESLIDCMDVERPMKPLRPSGRNLMAARALPRGLTSSESPGGADMTCTQKCSVTQEHNADSIMDDFGSTSQITPL